MTALRWGLIGCGDISQKRVAPALRDLPNCDLVAVNRARPELAESFAKSFGARRWYADWQDLLNDPEIDAVYIATPVHLHVTQTIAAAEAGKHVLCEKPLALDVGECDRMIDACRQSGVRLGVAYYRRFYPVIERIKEIIAAGEIGQPVFAQINAFELFDPPPDHPRHWFVERAKAGGGPMFDFGCHRIEILLNLFGPVRTVSSVIANVAFERDVEDTAAALFEFERGGCASLAITHAAVEPQDTLSVFGTRGSVHVGVLNKGDLTIKTGAGAGAARAESHPPHPNLHLPLIDDFVRSVLAGVEPQVGGDTGRAVASIEEEIYRVGRGASRRQ